MNEQNQSLLQALSACVAACEQCAAACLQENEVKMMARCIQVDRDCADICALTARFVARGSEHTGHLLRGCTEICRACGDECARHPMDHCQACAEACRRCEAACQKATTACYLPPHNSGGRSRRAFGLLGERLYLFLNPSHHFHSHEHALHQSLWGHRLCFQ